MYVRIIELLLLTPKIFVLCFIISIYKSIYISLWIEWTFRRCYGFVELLKYFSFLSCFWCYLEFASMISASGTLFLWGSKVWCVHRDRIARVLWKLKTMGVCRYLNRCLFIYHKIIAWIPRVFKDRRHTCRYLKWHPFFFLHRLPMFFFPLI